MNAQPQRVLGYTVVLLDHSGEEIARVPDVYGEVPSIEVSGRPYKAVRRVYEDQVVVRYFQQVKA